MERAEIVITLFGKIIYLGLCLQLAVNVVKSLIFWSKKEKTAVLVALILSIPFCLWIGFDVVSPVFNVEQCYPGIIITGIAAAGGAQSLYDALGRLKDKLFWKAE